VNRFGLRGAVFGLLLSAGVYTVAMSFGFFLVIYRKAIRLGVS
jgi:hypothetical protein